MTFIPAIVYNIYMNNDTLLSTKEAAIRWGLSQDHIRRLLEDGIIKGKKIGKSWVVLELNYVRKRKIGGGRKRKGG